ncbi:MAG: nucleotidyltransferase domain-containing protein [Pseudomonadota bacterium]|nr:nucleotidyltransferase domain-containing protein [Pseudomonadota bacterium]
MPMSLSPSSVNIWPDRQTVDDAVREWAGRQVKSRPDIRGIAYFGSYARGNWGPGSDVDILVIVAAAGTPFLERPRNWDVSTLPVPADVLVYTEGEWAAMPADSRFVQTITCEAVWVYEL